MFLIDVFLIKRRVIPLDTELWESFQGCMKCSKFLNVAAAPSANFQCFRKIVNKFDIGYTKILLEFIIFPV